MLFARLRSLQAQGLATARAGLTCASVNVVIYRLTYDYIEGGRLTMYKYLIATIIGAAALPAFGQDALFVDSDGEVGVGTNTPAATLDVQSDTGPQVRVLDPRATAADRVMFNLNGTAGTGKVRFFMSSADGSWTFDNNGNEFTINKVGNAGNELLVTGAGNMTLKGTLTEGSSRSVKDEIVPVKPHTVLAKVKQLPIAEWSYESTPSKRHIGPMAEDFYATFGLGPDNKHIAPKDLAGVALAAIQALSKEVEVLRASNGALRERIEQLEVTAAADAR